MGVAAALIVRMHLGGKSDVVAQGAFLLSLTGVALSMVIDYHACEQLWPISAATLALMIVTAVIDLGTDKSMAARME